jgi:hypothetical protein
MPVRRRGEVECATFQAHGQRRVCPFMTTARRKPEQVVPLPHQVLALHLDSSLDLDLLNAGVNEVLPCALRVTQITACFTVS